MYIWRPLSDPNLAIALSINFKELSDLSKLIDVIPATPWNSTSSLNVVIPSTERLFTVRFEPANPGPPGATTRLLTYKVLHRSDEDPKSLSARSPYQYYTGQ